MDVTLIHFSQTGNTRKVAKTMAEAFREAGHVARTVSLKDATPQAAQERLNVRNELWTFGNGCHNLS